MYYVNRTVTDSYGVFYNVCIRSYKPSLYGPLSILPLTVVFSVLRKLRQRSKCGSVVTYLVETVQNGVPSVL